MRPVMLNKKKRLAYSSYKLFCSSQGSLRGFAHTSIAETTTRTWRRILRVFTSALSTFGRRFPSASSVWYVPIAHGDVRDVITSNLTQGSSSF
jgi:hypothetical protein